MYLEECYIQNFKYEFIVFFCKLCLQGPLFVLVQSQGQEQYVYYSALAVE